MPRKFTESYHHEKPSIEDILYQFIGEEEEGGKIKQLKIISGVGVREYYKKLGYKLQDSYMVKTI